MLKTTPLPLATAALLILVAGCSSAGQGTAQAAYDACFNTEAEFSLLNLEGASVQIVVDGQAASALAGTDDELDRVLAGDGPGEGEMSGLGVSFALMDSLECLVAETGYPGTSEQLVDGDEWEGWEYSFVEGAGSSFSASFTSIS